MESNKTDEKLADITGQVQHLSEIHAHYMNHRMQFKLARSKLIYAWNYSFNAVAFALVVKRKYTEMYALPLFVKMNNKDVQMH